MKLKAEKYELTFECTNYDEYINFLEVLDRLDTCWCNRDGGTCKDCMLKSIVDDRVMTYATYLLPFIIVHFKYNKGSNTYKVLEPLLS